MSEQESNRDCTLKEKIELEQSEDEAMANRQNKRETSMLRCKRTKLKEYK